MMRTASYGCWADFWRPLASGYGRKVFISWTCLGSDVLKIVMGIRLYIYIYVCIHDISYIWLYTIDIIRYLYMLDIYVYIYIHIHMECNPHPGESLSHSTMIGGFWTLPISSVRMSELFLNEENRVLNGERRFFLMAKDATCQNRFISNWMAPQFIAIVLVRGHD